MFSQYLRTDSPSKKENGMGFLNISHEGKISPEKSLKEELKLSPKTSPIKIRKKIADEKIKALGEKSRKLSPPLYSRKKFAKEEQEEAKSKLKGLLASMKKINSEPQNSFISPFLAPGSGTDTSDSGDESFGDSDSTLLNNGLISPGLEMDLGLGMDYLIDEQDNEGILPPSADFEIDFDKLGKRKTILGSGDFDDDTGASKHLKI